MSRARTAAAACALAVACALAPGFALAQADTSAQAAYDRGLAALRGNRYGEAALAFEDSYRIAPLPAVLYNLALAYRGAGRNLLAAENFSRYLREEVVAIAPDRRAAVEAAIRELRAGLGSIDCRVSPQGAVVAVDGHTVECGRPVLVDPGDHVIEARAEAYVSQSRALRLAPGATETFHVDLAPSAPRPPEAQALPRPGVVIAPPRETPRATPVYERWWFWTAIGVAAVGAGVGIWAATRDREAPLDANFTAQAIRGW